MTPEEEQKLRNFRLLGGGSSMELPQQQQQQPTAPLLGQGAGEQGMSPEILAGLGLGGGIVAGQVGGAPSTSMRLSPFAQGIADLDANRLAQQGRPNLIGTPQTTTTTPRVVGPNTPPQYTGPSPARPVPGTQMVPTGQAPAVGSQGGSPAVRPAQVTSVNTVPRGAPLLGKASQLSRAAGPLALYTLADLGVQQMTGKGISSRVGEGLGGVIGSALYGDTSQPAFTQEELAASIANNPQQPIDLGTLERQSAPAQEADPIRSTFTSPNGEVVMERESGERFNPTADQLQSFNSTMQAVSQPTATGMGVGGDEGVVFGGGQAPMSTEETQAMLQERFGAPTISAIQSLPAGQGSGMQTDAQGRMIDPNVDRSDFEQASADLQARIAGRPDFNEPQASQNVPQDVREAAANPRPTPQQQARLAQWEGSTQGQQMGGAQGLAGTEGLTFDQQISARRQNLAEKKFEYDIVSDAKKAYDSELKSVRESQTEEAKAESSGKGMVRSVTDMKTVMKRAAGRLDQFMSTGMTGKAASFWKGSEADAQEQDFAFLQSNAALNSMLELKRLSPTGSTGFGALSAPELKVLQNQFASLDPFTDPELVRKNLVQFRDRFDSIIKDAHAEHKKEYGEEAANRVYGEMLNTDSQQGQTQAPSVNYEGTDFEIIPGQ